MNWNRLFFRVWLILLADIVQGAGFGFIADGMAGAWLQCGLISLALLFPAVVS